MHTEPHSHALVDSRGGVAQATSRRCPTYADIEALPDGLRGEIIGGVLIAMPRPGLPHTHAAGLLGSLLTASFHYRFGAPGGWVILPEPELRLGVDPSFDPVVPDIAGWRVPGEFPEALRQSAARVAPDWVCEVLSPSTAARDRTEKLPFYGRAGIQYVWLADPEHRTLEAYAFVGGAWSLTGAWSEAAKVKALPFGAVEFDLSLLWLPPVAEAPTEATPPALEPPAP